jgi:hypothetical protein
VQIHTLIEVDAAAETYIAGKSQPDSPLNTDYSGHVHD